MAGVKEEVTPEGGGGGLNGGASLSGKKAYWRSQSWSASRTAETGGGGGLTLDLPEKNPFANRRAGGPPLTPRSQQNWKARSCLPPLQPLAIARRSVDEWPMAGSDDVGEWPHPPTPGARKPGEELRVDVSLLRTEGKRNQIAFFDKECSKVADHIYLGGDAVAKNREILSKNGITHVLNCVGFVCPEYFKADLVYKTLWLQDSPSEDITSILYDVFDYFEDVREQGGRVFVHCCQGVSRSTSLVIAYLMWRNGQSFEDAFDFVKAARGIANPNMGFACQLLQCQKRVHAIPLSPNSVLRMYRMAPHSPYDSLHLVPKMLNDPSPMALDSRGAFILHVLSSIYVWVGNNCRPVMERDAKAAAYQVVRYERVPGPIYTVEEGNEPADFWEAFLRVQFLANSSTKFNKEHYDSGINIDIGKRKNDAYDADFELFYKGLAGGVVPPFSSAESGQETHLPARESNWSVLRRKFISGGTKGWVSTTKTPISRAYSDSLLAREPDVYINRDLHSVDSSASPSRLSASTLYSDSSYSPGSSSPSPSFSHPTNSASIVLELENSASLCHEAALLSSKVSSGYLAERRKNFTPLLKLPSSLGGLSRSSRVTEESPVFHGDNQNGFMKDDNDNTTNYDDLDNQDKDVDAGVSVGKVANISTKHYRKLDRDPMQCASSTCSTGDAVCEKLNGSI